MTKQIQLEVSTQKQAECPPWHELRYPWLTAATFGKICSKMEKQRAKPEHTAYTNINYVKEGLWKWTCGHPSLLRIASMEACFHLWMWHFHKPGRSTFSFHPQPHVLWPQQRKSLGSYRSKMPVHCKGHITRWGCLKAKQFYKQYQGWHTFRNTTLNYNLLSHIVWFCDMYRKSNSSPEN